MRNTVALKEIDNGQIIAKNRGDDSDLHHRWCLGDILVSMQHAQWVVNKGQHFSYLGRAESSKVLLACDWPHGTPKRTFTRLGCPKSTSVSKLASPFSLSCRTQR
jgi:hypothetical protein